MREILFRGKRVDNGEWVQGFYALFASNKGLKHGIYTVAENGCIIPYEVDLETVGQYTGLIDKNCKKIFEGDIVKWYSELVVVKFGEYDSIEQSYEVGNHFRKVDKFGWFGERQNCCSKGIEVILLKDGEVIGNIHDNPELIKKKK